LPETSGDFPRPIPGLVVGKHHQTPWQSAPPGVFTRGSSFGGSGEPWIEGLATERGGGVCFSGTFNGGTLDLGGGSLASAGGDDIFVGCLGSGGEHRWSRHLGGANADWGRELAIDAEGNLYLCGNFNGEAVDLGEGALPWAGGGDVFVASLTPTGDHRWSTALGAPHEDSAIAVALDASGNVYVTGYMGGGLDAAKNPLPKSIFVARLDGSSRGGIRWQKHFGDHPGDAGKAVAVDASGNIYVTGSFGGTVNFGGGSLVASAESVDAFVASFTAEGAQRWSKRFGGPSDDAASAVAVDGDSTICVTGSFARTIDLGGGPIEGAGTSDGFLASFTASGDHLWSRRLGQSGSSAGEALAIDAARNIYVAGSFSGTLDLGDALLVGAGGTDTFLASFTSDGTHRWSRAFGGPGDDVGYKGNRVAVDGSGSIYFAGAFQGTVDFGAGPLTAAGTTDIFLLKLSE
jgi:hypothetical protein